MTKSDVDVALTLEGARRRWPRQTAEFAWGYFLILPALLLMALVIGVPLVKAVGISLTNSTFINPVPTFVGLRNFALMVQSSIFWEVVSTSLIWTGTVVVAQLICGFATALLLNLRFRGRGLARALIILPWVCPGVIAAIIWRVIDDPYLGPINAALAWAGLRHPTIAWLGQPATALGAVIVAAIWKGTPFSTVMYLAALQGVSTEVLEAATIDGAGAWGRLRHVIIPQTMPVIRVLLLLTTVWTFNYFELVYIMTQGGPGDATQIFPTYIYKLAFDQIRYGAASAYGMIALLILLVFSLLYIAQLNKARVLE
jgi:multiple sugar transport system permease protein